LKKKKRNVSRGNVVKATTRRQLAIIGSRLGRTFDLGRYWRRILYRDLGGEATFHGDLEGEALPEKKKME